MTTNELDPGDRAGRAWRRALRRPSPRASWWKSAWPTGSPAMDSPIGPLIVAWNGPGVSAVEAAADDAHVRGASMPRGPAERPTERPRCRAAWRRRSIAGWRRPTGPHRPRPARPYRVRARRLGQGPGDPARRGPAVRLDRGRDRPAEGGPGRGHGPRPQPGPAHRPVPSRRPDRRDRSASTRSAARPTSGRSWPPKGSIRPGSRPWPVRASGSSAPTRPRSSACRPAITPGGSPSRTASPFRSHGRRGRRRLPRLPGLPARVRGRARGRLTSRPRVAPAGHGPARRRLHRSWTSTLCQRTRRLGRARPSIWVGDAHPVRRLGLDLPRRSPSRSRRSRRSSWPPSGSPSPAASCSRWSIPATRRSFALADPTRVARLGDRRGAAARWRDGPGRLGRADHPVGHRGAAHRDDAGLGRGPRRASSSASGCHGSPSSASSSGFAGVVDPRRPVGVRRRRVPWIRPGVARSCSRRSRGPPARSSPRIARRCPAGRSWRPAPRC